MRYSLEVEKEILDAELDFLAAKIKVLYKYREAKLPPEDEKRFERKLDKKYEILNVYISIQKKVKRFEELIGEHCKHHNWEEDYKEIYEYCRTGNDSYS